MAEVFQPSADSLTFTGEITLSAIAMNCGSWVACVEIVIETTKAPRRPSVASFLTIGIIWGYR